jgi:isoleucyl-tRNA synthetase
MSAFYLDILKDRVYTSKKDSLARRAGQTVMYEILDTMVRLIAPVLSFTSDEVWGCMPGKREASVHLADFPTLHPEWQNDELVVRWERIQKVRGDVSKALEQARVAKTIGHSLDAAVALTADAELLTFLRGYAAELATIFIVSNVELLDCLGDDAYPGEGVPGLKVQITAAPGTKCERCWCYSEELGTMADHPTICPKCTAAVS